MKRLFFSLVLSLCFIGNSYSADQWAKGSPATGDNPSNIATLQGVNNSALDRLVSNYKNGCKLTYDTAAQLSVGIGELTLSNSDGSVRKLRANTAATTVTWADIDPGAEAGSTTYYVYGIADTDATTFTCKISTSASAPIGATYYKRLGSFYNDASSNITNIVNDDNQETGKVYDSGWFAVATNTTYTKTHGLGTNKVLMTLWFSASADGSNAGEVPISMSGATGDAYCAWRNTLTTTQITITTAGMVMMQYSGASAQNVNSGYYRIIMLALE